MSSDWPIKSLQDVCIKITDGAHNSPKSVATGRSMASVKDLTRFGVDLSGARLIAKEDFDVLVKQGCKPEVGDVLIAKDGNSALDTVCNVKKPLDAVLLSSVAILRPDPKQLDSNYLKYYLSTKTTIDYLKSNFISGAAIPRVVLKDFKRAQIKVPPLSIQREIASVMDSIDDKIELNRQINQTLEQIAQAIFKSWFVDFEPVKAKIAARQTLTPALSQGERAEIVERAAMRAISGKTDAELDQLKHHPSPLGRGDGGEGKNSSNPTSKKHSQTLYDDLAATAALFPDEWVDSELGEIPRGWEQKRVDDILKLAYGKALKTTDRIEGDNPVYGSGGVTGSHNEYLVNGPGVIVGRKGTVGSLYWEDKDFFPIDTVFYVVPKAPLTYCYYLLQTQYLDRMNTDAAVPGLNRNNVYRLPVVFNNVVSEAFDERIKMLRAVIFSNVQQSVLLTEIRDSLLPKLLSGEITLGDTHSIVENVV